MSIYDGDERYEQLRHIREVEGYHGWLDEHLDKVSCPLCSDPVCTGLACLVEADGDQDGGDR
jgi:hypothetical protein